MALLSASTRRALWFLAAAATALGVAGCGGGAARPRPDLLFVSTKTGAYAIYEMNADGTDQRRLTSGGGTDSSTPTKLFYETDPAWSHDGRKIAFASRRYGSFDIFVVDADGKNLHRLTSTPDDDTRPTWSPDGKQIAFVRGGHGLIDVMNADGSHLHKLTTDSSREDDPAWSPDGRWIAYVRFTPLTTAKEIWLVHPNGTGLRQLTQLNASVATPAWSPDSKQLAFSSDAGGNNWAIYTVSLGSKKARLLVASDQDEFEPAWTPDGSRIAFTQGGAIVTIGSLGKGELTITDPKDNDSSPVWNPIPAPAKKS